MNQSYPASAEQELALQAVLRLAQTCEYPANHTHQVARLSLRLFDQLQPLHQLTPTHRFWLHAASILHDIGWIEGQKSHHKTTLNIILNTPLLPFGPNERLIIGSIARYHRKAIPSPSHDHFSALLPEDQLTVRILASLLRVADGLDRTHQNRVVDLHTNVTAHKVRLTCKISVPAAPEEQTATLEKANLFEQVFQRQLLLTWKPIS
jgi:exopolyphosphatase/guanosine-5'-triphosphate,3'-diphosphate pyrophosphatase